MEHRRRPRPHHDGVRVILLEVPLDLIAVGVALNELEDLQIVLGVAHDAGEVLEVEQAQVTLVVLPGFLEQVFAGLFVERSVDGFAVGRLGLLLLVVGQ